MICFHKWVKKYDELTYIWNGRLDTWLGCCKCGKRKRGTFISNDSKVGKSDE